MKKQLLFLIWTFSLIAFVGCADKKDTVVTTDIVDGKIVATGDIATFELSSNGTWTIDPDDQDWYDVNPKQGNGNGTITITILEPADPYDVDPRSANIRIMAGGTPQVITVEQPVTVTVEEGMPASNPADKNSWHICDNDVVSWEMDDDGIITSVIPTSAATVGNTKVGLEIGVDMPLSKGFSIEASVFIDDNQLCEMTKRFMISYYLPNGSGGQSLDYVTFQFRNIPGTGKHFQLWDPDDDRGGYWSNITGAGINTNAGWHTFKFKWINGVMQYFIDGVRIDTSVETIPGEPIMVPTNKFDGVTELKVNTFYYYGVAHAEEYEMKWTSPVIKYIEAEE